jgi:class 3 adenylate cyclase
MGGVDMAETRKIAAILAADVVGFSRMASADEDRTLARLRSLRADLIDPTVASQNGRVLVEFRSVVEAVRCASTRARDETEFSGSHFLRDGNDSADRRKIRGRRAPSRHPGIV